MSEGGRWMRRKKLGSLVGAGRAPECLGGPKPPRSPCPGHILRPSLRVTPGTVQPPSPQPGTRVPVRAWLALLLHPSPWPPCPPFPHKEQSGTLNMGPNLADPTRASFSRTARRRSFTVIHWVSVSPCGTGCLRVLWEACPLPSQSSDADPPAEQLLAEHLLHASLAARNVCLHTAGVRGWHVPQGGGPAPDPTSWGQGPLIHENRGWTTGSLRSLPRTHSPPTSLRHKEPASPLQDTRAQG